MAGAERAGTTTAAVTEAGVPAVVYASSVGAGLPTPPLSGRVAGGRVREIATGIGQRP